jgi:hypothetical protein
MFWDEFSFRLQVKAKRGQRILPFFPLVDQTMDKIQKNSFTQLVSYRQKPSKVNQNSVFIVSVWVY